jgi:apolipoprotein N-acyltransferase
MSATMSSPVPKWRTVQPALWLLLGGALAALSTGAYSIALAAWLAPLFLLCFARSQRIVVGLPLAAIIYGGAYAVAWRGTFGIPDGGFLLLGLLFFIPYVIDRLVAPRISGFTGTLVFPAAWVSLEYALASLPLLNGQPLGTWSGAAYSQTSNLPLLQVVSITGLWGVTFLIGWFTSIAAWAWQRGFAWHRVRWGVGGYMTLLALVLLWGGWRLASAPPVADAVRVAAIAVDNPALTVGVWNPVARGREVTEADQQDMRQQLQALHDTLLEATRKEARAGARIVVWAEDNAIVFKEDEEMLIARGRALARAEGIYLFMGMVALIPGEKAENKVVAVTPSGTVGFSYLKAYPTPWEASQRGDGVLHFLETDYGRLGAAICYDYDHPGLLRFAGRAGADIMMAPSDDGMQADPLHAHMASLRAIENGFALVRPVIGGRSLITDAYGRVLAQAEYGKDAYFAGGTHVLVAQVPTRGVPTVYARVGDVAAHLSLVGLLVLTAISILRPSGILYTLAWPHRRIRTRMS